MIFCYMIVYLMLLAHFSKHNIVNAVVCGEKNRLLKDNYPQTDCSKDVNSQCFHTYNEDLGNFYSLIENTRHKNNKPKSKRTSLLPILDSISKAPCHCEITFRLMDLGSSIYPRYVHTGICKKNTCGLFHRCQPKKYKIEVLKQRNSEFNEDFSELHDSHLPESLAGNWMPEHVNIVIACNCVPLKL